MQLFFAGSIHERDDQNQRKDEPSDEIDCGFGCHEEEAAIIKVVIFLQDATYNLLSIEWLLARGGNASMLGYRTSGISALAIATDNIPLNNHWNRSFVASVTFYWISPREKITTSISPLPVHNLR